ncbi:MAG: SsrA-binding protein SmpB [Rubinisphaera brasiliensis]|uniref:SsrA-binding protein n=1 Tax=Rubinisphaera brasiliensis (strain ATCC 49424 / DSM 5305 / JCM 21570 / IAM 15109 / NBRC 103401 / IFAM 1448) TaxID=756272 RepID=F0SMZ4_RUBBR|nr:SsrA-binding protein SmpB [Rubinisphaera brasiliensis]ADY59998.1 SsrA-binding protein [Rubinisphaera brasiliensis DSM 5305]MBR9802458.1 SsrA-binding protein SmpB [bacterium]
MADKKKNNKNNDPNNQTVAVNRRARHDYEILDEIECGIVLHGSEVKSIRNSQISIEESFAHTQNGELWLQGCHIGEYPQANVMNHIPRRHRKLLLHRKEIRKFAEAAKQKGLTLVPLSVYFRRGLVKVKVGVARGRKLHDKRDKLKKDAAQREMKAAMAKNLGRR